MSGYGIFLILLLQLVPNGGTKETEKNSTITLIRQVLNDITLLTEHIQSQETRLGERIRGLEADFSEQMRLHEIKMSEQMQSQELRLSRQIKQLGTTKLITKIQALETKMTGLEVKVTDRIHELETKVTGQVQRLETNVTVQMVNMTEQMTSQEEKMTDRIIRLDVKLTGQMEQEEVQIRAQDARIRVVESYVNVNASGVGELAKEIKKVSLKVDDVNKILTGGKAKKTPAPSCSWLRDHYFNLKSGRYWISSGNQVNYVYCDMDRLKVPFTECHGANINSLQFVIKYPASGDYNNFEYCNWNIRTGERVTLVFTQFDLADYVGDDFVAVSVDGREIGRWGKDNGIPPQLSLNGDINIAFSTDQSRIATGFQVYVFSDSECLYTNTSINTTDSDMGTNMTVWSNMTFPNSTYCTFTKCHGPKITTTQTSIKYPAIGIYGNHDNCEWHIQIDRKVTLRFTHFDLKDDSNLDFVKLVVDENIIGRWGRDNEPPASLTLTGDIKLIFHSDVSVRGTGFQVYINDS